MNTFKTLSRNFFLMIAIICLSSLNLKAQNALKRIGVIYIDAKGWTTNLPVTQLTRIELSKLNLYDVIDRFDIEDVMKKNNKKDTDCLARECLIETGKLLKCDYILSGSVEKFGDKVLVMFREIDVQTSNTLKTVIKDFPDAAIDPEVMIEVTLKEMYGIAITDPNKQNLDQKTKINTAITNPNEATVSIGGPRFGFAFLTGTSAEFMRREKSQGGQEGYPALFQFGYQFEKVYLNEGNLQAIVEFLPMLSGMDQGLLLPSFTLLNGFRSAKSGWEFAFGPTVSWTRVARGYVVGDQWHLEEEWYSSSATAANPNTIITKNDTRGDLQSKPGILLAFGKTFKSGKLNMPLNFYVVPRAKSLQLGVSYGFNAMRTKSVSE